MPGGHNAATGACSGVDRIGRIAGCSTLVTIAPEQVASGVRVILVLAASTPSPASTQAGDDLPKTGSDWALPAGALGLLLLALGVGMLAIERKPAHHRH